MSDVHSASNKTGFPQPFVPEELVREILLRLPIKSIGTCMLVCNSWKHLIKSSSFIRSSHIHRYGDNGAQLLLVQADDPKKRKPYMERGQVALHWDNAELGHYTKLTHPFARYFDNSLRLYVAGTCNGLVCISTHARQPIFVWNPCIRKLLKLPPTTNNYVSWYAFGYDSDGNDYKVLRIPLFCTRQSYPLQIWSLAKGSWKDLDRPYVHDHNDDKLIRQSLCREAAFVKGAFHWPPISKDQACFIPSFDISRELFGETMICEDLRKQICAGDPSNFHILKYRESLALCEIVHQPLRFEIDRQPLSFVDMWVMNEYGQTESWTKLFSLSIDRWVGNPLCVRKSNGEVALRMWSGCKVRSVDPTTREVKTIPELWRGCYFMDSFVESLVLIDHPGAKPH